MRRRLTFLHDTELDIDSKQLVLSGSRFHVKDLKCGREERLTFGFDELPQELWQVLRQSHELHIRWQTSNPFNTTAPLVSRISPGLHIYYTPLNSNSERADVLCPLLHEVFSWELKCQSPNITFSSPSLVSSRFASASSLQYHSNLHRISSLVNYIQRKICTNKDQSCLHTASLLNIADSLDIDYDSISHALVLTAYWSKPPPVLYDPLTQMTASNAWTLNIDAAASDTVEVGVLHDSRPADKHDIQLGGLLTVVGEDETPKPTLFQFPSRHHPLTLQQNVEQAYTVSFDKPTGLHPTMRVSFPSASTLTPPSTKPDDSTCALHTYLTLPSALFADQYQLSTTDPLFLQTHNLKALRAISGALDLEAPDYVVEQWGSNLLLELATPGPQDSGREEWDVTIPLHLRYLAPTANSSGQTQASIPWPVLFWACTAEDGTKFPVNPFDRVNLGYEGLFGSRTMFFHLTPKTQEKGGLVETVNVPVMDMDAVGATVVEGGTVFVVLVGFLWVCWKLWPGLARGMFGEKEIIREKKAQ